MHFLKYLWVQMWPNMAAPSIWTVLGIAISHVRLKAHVNRKHEELKERDHGMTTPVHSAEGRDFSDFQRTQAVADIKADDFDFTKATEGTGWTSVTFPANWANMEAAGRPRGAYHFLHPGADPVAQARHFHSVVKAAGIRHGDMLVVDSELTAGVAAIAPVKGGAIRNHLPLTDADLATTPSRVDACTKAFLDEVSRLLIADGFFRRTGILRRKVPTCPLITYTMHAVGQYLASTAKAYPVLWFAWPSSTAPPAGMIAPWKSWTFWQWAFASKESGGGDADAFNGTPAALHAFIASYLPLIRKPVAVVTDGSLSLLAICREHGDSVPVTVVRSLTRKMQPSLIRYLLRGDPAANMPKGITLVVVEGVPAS